MSFTELKSDTWSSKLSGKVVVLSGGATGIGEATVRLLHSLNATVVFCDVNTEQGKALEEELTSKSSTPPVRFKRADVSKYSDVVAVFESALSEFGRVDVAVSNAGILERGNWFDPDLDVTNIKAEPDTAVLDVNLLGTLYFSRVAMPFLRHGAKSTENQTEKLDKSLVLMSSVAGFKETPGIFIYQATKHGIIGLMRSLRIYTPDKHGVRVNCICPWATATSMTASFADFWAKNNLPMNETLDVAKAVVQAATDENMNGESLYVEGGRCWAIEGKLDALQPQWLGEEPSERLERGQKVLGIGGKWNVGLKPVD